MRLTQWKPDDLTTQNLAALTMHLQKACEASQKMQDYIKGIPHENGMVQEIELTYVRAILDTIIRRCTFAKDIVQAEIERY